MITEVKPEDFVRSAKLSLPDEFEAENNVQVTRKRTWRTLWLKKQNFVESGVLRGITTDMLLVQIQAKNKELVSLLRAHIEDRAIKIIDQTRNDCFNRFKIKIDDLKASLDKAEEKFKSKEGRDKFELEMPFLAATRFYVVSGF